MIAARVFDRAGTSGGHSGIWSWGDDMPIGAPLFALPQDSVQMGCSSIFTNRERITKRTISPHVIGLGAMMWLGCGAGADAAAEKKLPPTNTDCLCVCTRGQLPTIHVNPHEGPDPRVGKQFPNSKPTKTQSINPGLGHESRTPGFCRSTTAPHPIVNQCSIKTPDTDSRRHLLPRPALYPPAPPTMVANASHHHRSTTKSSNKAFKSRHSTKSFLKARNKGIPHYPPMVRPQFLTPHQAKSKMGPPAASERI